MPVASDAAMVQPLPCQFTTLAALMPTRSVEPTLTTLTIPPAALDAAGVDAREVTQVDLTPEGSSPVCRDRCPAVLTVEGSRQSTVPADGWGSHRSLTAMRPSLDAMTYTDDNASEPTTPDWTSADTERLDPVDQTQQIPAEDASVEQASVDAAESPASGEPRVTEAAPASTAIPPVPPSPVAPLKPESNSPWRGKRLAVAAGAALGIATLGAAAGAGAVALTHHDNASSSQVRGGGDGDQFGQDQVGPGQFQGGRGGGHGRGGMGMPPGGEQGQLDPNGGQGQMDPDGGTGQADPNGSSSSNGSTTPSTPKQGNTLPVPAT